MADKKLIATVDSIINRPDINMFLNYIQKVEGGKHGIVTGHTKKHPKVYTPEEALNGHPWEGKEGDSAAGPWQINVATYKDYAKRLGIKGFTPENQKRIAVAMLASTSGDGKRIKAYGNTAAQEIVNGNPMEAINKLGGKWAALPSSIYDNQNHTTWEFADAYFKNSGKNLPEMKRIKGYYPYARYKAQLPVLANKAPAVTNPAVTNQTIDKPQFPNPFKTNPFYMYAKEAINSPYEAQVEAINDSNNLMPDPFNSLNPSMQETPGIYLKPFVDEVSSGIGNAYDKLINAFGIRNAMAADNLFSNVTTAKSMFNDPVFTADLDNTAADIKNNAVNQFIYGGNAPQMPESVAMNDQVLSAINDVMGRIKNG